MIELINLSKVYSNSKFDVEAIKNLNLKFKDNGFVFIVGKSGCGKSTLLNLMGGLDSVTLGDIVCDGNHLSKMTEKELNDYRNRYLGFVFQDYCLIEDLTVYENIALALDIKGEKISREKRKELVYSTLEKVELDKSMANRKIKELSGGQRQALTLLMATMTKPKLLLLDEHTAALDPKTAAKVLDLTEKIVNRDKLTTLMITHNMRDALRCGNRLIMLHNGRIIIDVEGEEKKKLDVPDLLKMFEQASGDEFASDRALLG